MGPILVSFLFFDLLYPRNHKSLVKSVKCRQEFHKEFKNIKKKTKKKSNILGVCNILIPIYFWYGTRAIAINMLTYDIKIRNIEKEIIKLFWKINGLQTKTEKTFLFTMRPLSFCCGFLIGLKHKMTIPIKEQLWTLSWTVGCWI